VGWDEISLANYPSEVHLSADEVRIGRNLAENFRNEGADPLVKVSCEKNFLPGLKPPNLGGGGGGGMGIHSLEATSLKTMDRKNLLIVVSRKAVSIKNQKN
jgi:hypothetical protein